MKRYIVRLDDACPTMKVDHWDRVERAMIDIGADVVVGVVPDNRDPALECDRPDPHFWHKVRRWQERGWKIALHGLHHRLSPIPSAATNLVPLDPMTEFVGLTYERQAEMIARGLALLAAEGIRPTMWMAPAHSMDLNTVRAVADESHIRIVTDGIARYPFSEHGLLWLPQQLWQLPARGSGVWTVCVHPNLLTGSELDTLLAGIRTHAREVCTDIGAIVQEFEGRARSMADRSFRWSFLGKRRLLPALVGIKHALQRRD